jgi:hypothetical protein
MTSGVRHDTPLAFTVAMSFLMGIVTTIAVYSLRTDNRAADVTAIRASAASPSDDTVANASSNDQSDPVTKEPAATVPPSPVSPTEAGEIVGAT